MSRSIILLCICTILAITVPHTGNAALKQTSGKITLLRVHDVGTRYGPATDQINVEVVVCLDKQNDKAYGFQLRNDSNQAVRQGMLDLLLDAFAHEWTVTIDYEIDGGKDNGIIRRLWVEK